MTFTKFARYVLSLQPTFACTLNRARASDFCLSDKSVRAALKRLVHLRLTSLLGLLRAT